VGIHGNHAGNTKDNACCCCCCRTNDDDDAIAAVVAAIVVVVGDSVPQLHLTLRLTLRELGGVDNGKLLHVMANPAAAVGVVAERTNER
jgi:hypothetical protein